MEIFEAESIREKYLEIDYYHLFIISPTGIKSERAFQQLAHLNFIYIDDLTLKKMLDLKFFS